MSDENRPRILDRAVDDVSASKTPLGTGAPLALRYRLESLRGFNPIDVLRYKEYLQFVTDRDEPLRPLEDPLTFPVIVNFEIRNDKFLDLLGARYLLQPSALPENSQRWKSVLGDPQPVGFDCIAGGTVPLPPYTVYENRSDQLFPRAFVVPSALPLPDDSQPGKNGASLLDYFFQSR